MNRSEELSQDVGSYIADSIGVRDLEAIPVALPVASTPATNGQFAGRTRHKSACMIDRDRIIPDPNQPRRTFGQEELEQLAHSLQTKGQLQPIRVRWDEGLNSYVLIMGERRWRAAKLTNLRQLDCVVHDEPLNEAEIFELQLIENAIRQDLNPIEQATAFSTLLEKKKISARQLASELRLNVSTISRALSLLKLPAEIQQQITQGKVPPAVAREIAKLENESQQTEMVEQYLAGDLNSADAAAIVSQAKGGKAPKETSTGTTKTITVGPGRKVTFASKKRESSAEIVAALRLAAEMLETDGRAKRKSA